MAPVGQTRISIHGVACRRATRPLALAPCSKSRVASVKCREASAVGGHSKRAIERQVTAALLPWSLRPRCNGWRQPVLNAGPPAPPVTTQTRVERTFLLRGSREPMARFRSNLLAGKRTSQQHHRPTQTSVQVAYPAPRLFQPAKKTDHPRHPVLRMVCRFLACRSAYPAANCRST